MQLLHKDGIVEVGNLESKEGSRPLLCSNEAPNRGPSLDFIEKENKLKNARAMLKNLISHIIEDEINKYINNLYAKR